MALLLQTYASPGPREASLAEVSALRAELAFWMCLNHAGELNPVKNDLRRKLDQGSGDRRGILRRNHDAGSLVAHLAYDFDQAGNEVGAADVLVGLVEHHELVEPAALVGGVGKHLQQNDEQSEGLVLVDELVSEIDDHEASRT